MREHMTHLYSQCIHADIWNGIGFLDLRKDDLILNLYMES